jgi:hypothetical protein
MVGSREGSGAAAPGCEGGLGVAVGAGGGRGGVARQDASSSVTPVSVTAARHNNIAAAGRRMRNVDRIILDPLKCIHSDRACSAAPVQLFSEADGLRLRPRL